MTSTNIPVASHTTRNGDQLGAGVTADATNGNHFANDGNTLLMVFGVTATKAVTVVTSGTVGGLAVADLPARPVAAGEYHLMGPFPVALFGSQVEVTYEASTAHKVWAFNNTAK
jgi:hypothetical protein